MNKFDFKFTKNLDIFYHRLASTAPKETKTEEFDFACLDCVVKVTCTFRPSFTNQDYYKIIQRIFFERNITLGDFWKIYFCIGHYEKDVQIEAGLKAWFCWKFFVFLIRFSMTYIVIYFQHSFRFYFVCYFL